MPDPVVSAILERSEDRLIVTGASGWLGMATLEFLFDALGEEAARRRIVCFGSAPRTLDLRNHRRVDQKALSELGDLATEPSTLFHFAFLTKDRAQSMDEAAYRAANNAISAQILSQIDRIGVDRVLLASSGAAYAGADDQSIAPEMRLYGEMKRSDELRFAEWAEGAGRRLAIARIFNVTGPYINKHQAYAFASFLLDGLAGRPIEVRASHCVVRGYVAIREVMALALALLHESQAPGVIRFDTGGEPMELGRVADFVADQFPSSHVVRAPIGSAVSDSYHGDFEAYARLLSTHGIASVSMKEQVRETMDYLKLIVGPNNDACSPALA